MTNGVQPRSSSSPITRDRAAIAIGEELSLRELPDGVVTHLEGARDGPALAAFLGKAGLKSLPAIGSVMQNETTRLLGIGPSIWLLIADTPQSADEAFAVALDMSGAWTRIRIAGARAPDLMAKGCSIDLHPRSLPQGACATAGFAHLRAIIWRTSEQNEFVVFIARSYARSLWHWLIENAAEYGCRWPGNGTTADDDRRLQTKAQERNGE